MKIFENPKLKSMVIKSILVLTTLAWSPGKKTGNNVIKKKITQIVLLRYFSKEKKLIFLMYKTVNKARKEVNINNLVSFGAIVDSVVTSGKIIKKSAANSHEDRRGRFIFFSILNFEIIVRVEKKAVIKKIKITEYCLKVNGTIFNMIEKIKIKLNKKNKFLDIIDNW